MYPFKKFSLGELKGISTHIHRPVGDPIMYKLITHPLCEFIQKRLSPKILPNTITWLGFCATSLGTILVMLFDWNLTQSSRLLSLVYVAIMIFYIIADSLDGIHARNSKQTSSLGKILDHFLDSTTASSSLFMVGSSLKIGISPFFKYVMIVVFFGFYCTALLDKYTGSMIFSNISGASEGLYMMAAIHLAAVFYPNLLHSYLKSPFHRSRLAFITTLISAGYIICVFIDMIYRIKKTKPSINMKHVGFSMVRLVILMLLFVPFAVSGHVSRLYNTTYFAIIAQSFSLCYLEECISSLTKFGVSGPVFVIQYALLALKGLNLLYWKSTRVEYLLIILSTSHFIIRVGSVLFEMAHSLRVKLFNSKL